MSQGDIKEIETGVEATECQLLAGEIYGERRNNHYICQFRLVNEMITNEVVN